MAGEILSLVAMLRTLTLLFVGLSLVVSTASAVTVFATFSETINSTSVANTSMGDTLMIEFALDNGGSDLINQTWNASDVVSLTFSKPDESFQTVFGAEAFSTSVGSFTTDSGGNLTAVPSDWTDTNVMVTPTTTSSFSPDLWYVDGSSFVYAEGFGDFSISIDNASTITNAANWNLSTVSAIPEPSTVALSLGGDGSALVFWRKRFRN